MTGQITAIAMEVPRHEYIYVSMDATDEHEVEIKGACPMSWKSIGPTASEHIYADEERWSR